MAFLEHRIVYRLTYGQPGAMQVDEAAVDPHGSAELVSLYVAVMNYTAIGDLVIDPQRPLDVPDQLTTTVKGGFYYQPLKSRAVSTGTIPAVDVTLDGPSDQRAIKATLSPLSASDRRVYISGKPEEQEQVVSAFGLTVHIGRVVLENIVVGSPIAQKQGQSSAQASDLVDRYVSSVLRTQRLPGLREIATRI